MSDSQKADILIIGGGLFGLASAITLQKRGFQCLVVDRDQIPSQKAASTDISKIVRMEYGNDSQYMEMVEAALPKWRTWNEMNNSPIFHETGVGMFCSQPMEQGGFEWDSYQKLLERGNRVQRLKKDDISRHFPALSNSTLCDGFFHSKGGYSESARTIEFLLNEAISLGVKIKTGFGDSRILKNAEKVIGVINHKGERLCADYYILAAGAWSPFLLPGLKKYMKVSGHPVFHLKSENNDAFKSPRLSVFTADISTTGWYGFPLHPFHEVVKLANHGIGQFIHPVNDERRVNESDVMNVNRFIRSTIPGLEGAKIVYTRRCLYCDTIDEHFLFDWCPWLKNMFIATGGSGHGFKFAPILGDLVADAFERKKGVWFQKFQWREFDDQSRGEEAARYHG